MNKQTQSPVKSTSSDSSGTASNLTVKDSSKAFVVRLERPEAPIEIPLQLTPLARYRMGSLLNAPAFEDLATPNKTFFALVSLFWAMLPKELHSAYATPVDCAELVALDQGQISRAVIDAIISSTAGEVKRSKGAPTTSRSAR